MRLNNLGNNIYEVMFNLIKESLSFRSGLKLRINKILDIFNEVLSVMWLIFKLCIFIS